MPVSKSSEYKNLLLAALPPDELERLSRHFTPVALPRRTQLELPNKKIRQIYFMETGITSIVAAHAAEHQVEVGIIGREGMTGLAVVLHNDRFPYSSYIQVDGSAQRVEADVVREAMERSPECRRVFLGSAQTFLIQVAETAVANAKATISERLARWLLMVQDRVGGKEIHLTHEFLSLMMGARRPGVTDAIQGLKRDGLIATRRGTIEVMDRAGLEERASHYYGVPEKELTKALSASR
jgi:CRP-like cAMP-binding protein